jgi:plastocyanin
MPVSPSPRLGAVGPPLIAICLLLTACGGSTPSAASTEAPVPSIGAQASASPVVSIAPSGTPNDRPSISVEPSPTASQAAATPSLAANPSPPGSGRPSDTATPAPTGQPTPAPTPAPTKTARPTPKATPGPTAAPVVLGIEARDFQFSPSSLTGPAGVAFGITFTNADEAIPHNVTIATDTGTLQFNGTIIIGVASASYQVPALATGDYRLGCIVHPAMTGTLAIR